MAFTDGSHSIRTPCGREVRLAIRRKMGRTSYLAQRAACCLYIQQKTLEYVERPESVVISHGLEIFGLVRAWIHDTLVELKGGDRFACHMTELLEEADSVKKIHPFHQIGQDGRAVKALD